MYFVYGSTEYSSVVARVKFTQFKGDYGCFWMQNVFVICECKHKQITQKLNNQVLADEHETISRVKIGNCSSIL